MRVLVACECSGRVREAFRAMGHDAWSCDLQPADDGSPYHITGDVLPVLGDGWDMMVAHPPCTHLAIGGARHWKQKREDGRQAEAAALFMRFINAPIHRIAVENPAGIMSNLYRRPDQYIQPYWFGDRAQKRTGLWLKNLPLLIPTNVVDKGDYRTLSNGKTRPEFMWRHTTDRARQRSVTFEGVANAMAAQWSGELAAYQPLLLEVAS